MTQNISAAFRHLGIALIDLEYAILELSQSSRLAALRGAHDDAPLHQLICERNKLQDLSRRLAALAQHEPLDAGWTRRWWPEQARSAAPDCVVKPPQSSDPAL